MKLEYKCECLIKIIELYELNSVQSNQFSNT